MLLFKDIFIHYRSTYIEYILHKLFSFNTAKVVLSQGGCQKNLLSYSFFYDKGKSIPDYIFFLVEAVRLKASLKTYNSYDIIMKYSSFWIWKPKCIIYYKFLVFDFSIWFSRCIFIKLKSLISEEWWYVRKKGLVISSLLCIF